MNAVGFAPAVSESGAGIRKVVLVGHPNVGKSAVFSKLTGRFVTISNFPGTTVEVFRGRVSVDGREYEVVDTPGVHGLAGSSPDEQVTAGLLEIEQPDLIVQVADAADLRRTLMLTARLARLRLPLLLVLNMGDERAERGLRVDSRRLSRELGVPVIEAVAVRGEGIGQLLGRLDSAACVDPSSDPASIWAEELAAAVETRHARPAAAPIRAPVALLLLGSLLHLHNYAAALAAAPSWYGWLRAWLAGMTADPLVVDGGATLGGYVLPVLVPLLWALRTDPGFRSALGVWARRALPGSFILALTLSLTYQLVGVLGAQVLVELLEERLFGGWLFPPLARLLPQGFVRDLLVGEFGLVTVGLGYGVAIVLPVVFCFFLAFSFLEDSGYLPRLSLLSDRLFRPLGLNGKAFLPMVLGLGCVTMATLTTRILPSREERLIASVLLALGVPCSAQLGVILGITAGLSPWAMAVVFGTVALQLLLVGRLLAGIFGGGRSDFILEIPPMRSPLWSNIFRKTGLRVKWFAREALPLFLLGALLLFGLDRVGALERITAAAAPLLVGVLQLPAETASAFLVGFLRRDFGAAGLFDLARQGRLDAIQTVVSVTVMILFVPCLANLLVLIKEHRFLPAIGVFLSVTFYSLLVGAVLNLVLRGLGVTL